MPLDELSWDKGSSTNRDGYARKYATHDTFNKKYLLEDLEGTAFHPSSQENPSLWGHEYDIDLVITRDWMIAYVDEDAQMHIEGRNHDFSKFVEDILNPERNENGENHRL